ncbi:PREDICTED: sodium/potassium/calcium exchanger 1 isoform X1 [Gavialis gangeticus]|uniref:sodium/potassium/calcium exchanger 1 isoform X1 n=1 Tax=Gavialis gangeticus TaxID=94835 RepID=UPI00092E5091|nr:PREDICTED: sodium/potassium/calcium exchanger 1 isoform X1 [Gavialis gangeticus]
MHLPPRKKLRWNRVFFLLAMILTFSIYQFIYKPQILSASWGGSQPEEQVKVAIRDLSSNTTAAAHNDTTTPKIRQCVYVDPEPTVPISVAVSPSPLPGDVTSSHPDEERHSPTHAPKGEYPEDLFSVEDRRKGWVSLHIFGMMYVFVALAIVCDEFFVPALGVITEKLQISDDVAGATFMAAGGSAPELFTSLIGVFISHSNVGIGTIVGSAVFNILFVIGTCALFSREILHLTWWPLFRDISFYILDLLMLIAFFLDSLIDWWESLMLLSAYSMYVITMKWNVYFEQWVKDLLSKRRNFVQAAALEVKKKKSTGSILEDGAKPPGESKRLQLMPSLQRGGSSASLHNSQMRSTIFQLMIHTLDPLAEGEQMPLNYTIPCPTPIAAKFKDKVDILRNMAKAKIDSQLKLVTKSGEEAQVPSAVKVTPASDEEPSKEQDEQNADANVDPDAKADADPDAKGDANAAPDAKADADAPQDEQPSSEGEGSEESSSEEDSDDDSGDEDDDDDNDENDEPLSLEWPETRRKQAVYLFLLPIVFPLWTTVPDVRNPNSRKFFVFTFLGSILWIAIFSYLMVWWAHQVGETIGISEEIMGLTILAAGTSIPDLITSVIVARKGLGDMAVSSSVGSNIFDITVGLPVPWFLYSLFNGFKSVPVSSNGLFCAIVLLFLMLLFVIISIATSKWKMNKFLGFTMFALYFVFLIVSVMLEDRIISCPVSV